MQTAAHNLPHVRRATFALLLMTLFPVAAARGASRDGSGADLFAHGTGDRVWAARVAPQVDAKPPHDVTTNSPNTGFSFCANAERSGTPSRNGSPTATVPAPRRKARRLMRERTGFTGHLQYGSRIADFESPRAACS